MHHPTPEARSPFSSLTAPDLPYPLDTSTSDFHSIDKLLPNRMRSLLIVLVVLIGTTTMLGFQAPRPLRTRTGSLTAKTEDGTENAKASRKSKPRLSVADMQNKAKKEGEKKTKERDIGKGKRGKKAEKMAGKKGTKGKKERKDETKNQQLSNNNTGKKAVIKAAKKEKTILDLINESHEKAKVSQQRGQELHQEQDIQLAIHAKKRQEKKATQAKLVAVQKMSVFMNGPPNEKDNSAMQDALWRSEQLIAQREVEQEAKRRAENERLAKVAAMQSEIRLQQARVGQAAALAAEEKNVLAAAKEQELEATLTLPDSLPTLPDSPSEKLAKSEFDPSDMDKIAKKNPLLIAAELARQADIVAKQKSVSDAVLRAQQIQQQREADAEMIRKAEEKRSAQIEAMREEVRLHALQQEEAAAASAARKAAEAEERRKEAQRLYEERMAADEASRAALAERQREKEEEMREEARLMYEERMAALEKYRAEEEARVAAFRSSLLSADNDDLKDAESGLLAAEDDAPPLDVIEGECQEGADDQSSSLDDSADSSTEVDIETLPASPSGSLSDPLAMEKFDPVYMDNVGKKNPLLVAAELAREADIVAKQKSVSDAVLRAQQIQQQREADAEMIQKAEEERAARIQAMREEVRLQALRQEEAAAASTAKKAAEAEERRMEAQRLYVERMAADEAAKVAAAAKAAAIAEELRKEAQELSEQRQAAAEASRAAMAERQREKEKDMREEARLMYEERMAALEKYREEEEARVATFRSSLLSANNDDTDGADTGVLAADGEAPPLDVIEEGSEVDNNDVDRADTSVLSAVEGVPTLDVIEGDSNEVCDHSSLSIDADSSTEAGSDTLLLSESLPATSESPSECESLAKREVEPIDMEKVAKKNPLLIAAELAKEANIVAKQKSVSDAVLRAQQIQQQRETDAEMIRKAEEERSARIEAMREEVRLHALQQQEAAAASAARKAAEAEERRKEAQRLYEERMTADQAAKVAAVAKAAAMAEERRKEAQHLYEERITAAEASRAALAERQREKEEEMREEARIMYGERMTALEKYRAEEEARVNAFRSSLLSADSNDLNDAESGLLAAEEETAPLDEMERDSQGLNI